MRSWKTFVLVACGFGLLVSAAFLEQRQEPACRGAACASAYEGPVLQRLERSMECVVWICTTCFCKNRVTGETVATCY